MTVLPAYLEKASITPDDIHIFEDGEKSDCLATSEAIIVFVD